MPLHSLLSEQSITTYPYKYYCRPAYGSTQLLIEFFAIKERDPFFNNLLAALEPISCRIEGATDVWMNDEILITASSLHGPIEISINIYDFVFIMAHNNQPGIIAIDTVLQAAPRFEKVSANFDNYK